MREDVGRRTMEMEVQGGGLEEGLGEDGWTEDDIKEKALSADKNVHPCYMYRRTSTPHKSQTKKKIKMYDFICN